MAEVRFDSNKARVGDGTRITRVSDGGQVLEVMVDAKLEKFSRVVLYDPDLRTIDTFASTGGPFARPGDYLRAEAVFHREFIDGMTAPEAVDYLLEVIERRLAADNERVARVIDAAGRGEDGKGRLQRAQAQALLIFWDGRGRTVTHGFFGQRHEQETGRGADSLQITTYLRRLRPALDSIGWPLVITSVSGVGHRLDVTDADWQAPWEVA
ncbi:MAG: hypothetical protein U1D06_15225 [Paracoccaceae bacterium]|nr:hypothetical protein [Paracoccaceae bacterium]